MKKFFICIAAFMLAANVNAQNEIVFDTTNYEMLQEVVLNSRDLLVAHWQQVRHI